MKSGYLAKLWKMSHHMRSELDVDICCTPRLQVFMADFFLLFLQAKTLEILPYFLGGKKGTICKRVLSPLSWSQAIAFFICEHEEWNPVDAKVDLVFRWLLPSTRGRIWVPRQLCLGCLNSAGRRVQNWKQKKTFTTLLLRISFWKQCPEFVPETLSYKT